MNLVSGVLKWIRLGSFLVLKLDWRLSAVCLLWSHGSFARKLCCPKNDGESKTRRIPSADQFIPCEILVASGFDLDPSGCDLDSSVLDSCGYHGAHAQQSCTCCVGQIHRSIRDSAWVVGCRIRTKKTRGYERGSALARRATVKTLKDGRRAALFLLHRARSHVVSNGCSTPQSRH